jgi:hypothetical protein
LVSRLTVLLLHLLSLDDNPSLRARLTPMLADADASAVLIAPGEPGLPEANVPAEVQWSYQQTAYPDFRPKSAN